MTIITLDIAGQKLPDLIARAQLGEEIVIAADGTPIAKLVPISFERKPRVPGGMKGQLNLPDSFFFDPLPPEELKL